TAGRADERNTLAVLQVARLLPHQDHLRVRVACREYDLGGRLPQLTAAAAPGGLPQLGDPGLLRHPLCGAHVAMTRWIWTPRSRLRSPMLGTIPRIGPGDIHLRPRWGVTPRPDAQPEQFGDALDAAIVLSVVGDR